jgi:hypothetical protein
MKFRPELRDRLSEGSRPFLRHVMAATVDGDAVDSVTHRGQAVVQHVANTVVRTNHQDWHGQSLVRPRSGAREPVDGEGRAVVVQTGTECARGSQDARVLVKGNVIEQVWVITLACEEPPEEFPFAPADQ